MLSPLIVAIVLGAGYLAYDLALLRGAVLPGGDLRFAYLVAYVLAVLVAGSIVTWLVVPLPTGSGGRALRTKWSAALGFFASVPVAYLVMVVLLEIVRPLLR